eukprot:CAMPEP_0181230334 /NCGR_PEP_ID=MMETSP1096-20121128/34413_1 /TAXON_ID=156174 ORGANISM="Chrysochromulina ericina, Strain CCMP281" /NCGR_SAMPLE_ID=MMETSP1096 /ASSEMBLY_ACC=CAM_ASM_000453 /LENGTH=51 /DNA_ID=CAMNT_0023324093 /DNA_START=354 /DNA_END=505 /DNA_ORIENTATION=-
MVVDDWIFKPPRVIFEEHIWPRLQIAHECLKPSRLICSGDMRKWSCKETLT